MLSFQTIKPDTLELLKRLMTEPLFGQTRLVGGTALALQFGHRSSKCEWEVVIQHWPELPDCGLKADVYEQIAMNWDRFCDYLWENKEELK